MIEVNGIAHTVLCVKDFQKSCAFYEKLLPFLGLKRAFKGKESLYYVGGRTAVGIGPIDPKFKDNVFHQGNLGLHHLCFRARSREDIDKVDQFLREMNANVIHHAEEGPWAPGYYSVLFEDPDGIRLEVNFVPGKGIFAEGESFNPADDYK